ncbi:hypothetical protein D3C87_460290 [compost metagenome]
MLDNSAQYLGMITDKFYGALSADPSTRPTGGVIQAGDRYFNTTTQTERTYTGSAWTYSNSSLNLALGGAYVTLTGTVAKTALLTVPVAANLMGLNGRIEITLDFEFSNNTNQKEMSVQFGGVDIIGPWNTTNGSSWGSWLTYVISNRNSVSSQATSFKGNESAIGASYYDSDTKAVNTAVSQNIVVYGQLANAADHIYLRNYRITLFR